MMGWEYSGIRHFSDLILYFTKPEISHMLSPSSILESYWTVQLFQFYIYIFQLFACCGPEDFHSLRAKPIVRLGKNNRSPRNLVTLEHIIHSRVFFFFNVNICI